MLEIQPGPFPPHDERSHRQEEGATLRPIAYAKLDWNLLVAQVKQGDDGATEQLYKLFGRGIRYYFWRQLGCQELDDKVHDTFLIVVRAIRRGDIREPGHLMSFMRTVSRCQVASHIEQNIRTRRHQGDYAIAGLIADTKRNPEQEAMLLQRGEFLQSVMRELPARDREILLRFYVHEQSHEQICQEMQMTETQFRLMKSRAKAKFGGIGKKKLTSSRGFVAFPPAAA